MTDTNDHIPTEVSNTAVVKHRHQHDAMRELHFLLHHGKGFEIINLVGPSGVGKSTLCGKLVELIKLEEVNEVQHDPDYLPIIATKAVATGYRGFDWKGLYRDAALQLRDPFAYSRRPDKKAEAKQPRFLGEQLTTATYRRSLQEEFLYRRTKYWIIDEAQHILTGAKAGSPGDQFDVLKSMAQTTGVKIVLVGTYALLTHAASSAQLARRMTSVHLPRYKSSDRREMNTFASCALTLLKQFPFDYPDVAENLNFYYAGSTGCVGTFRDWCDRAAGKMIEWGDRALELKHFRKTRIFPNSLRTMWKELLDGEAFFDEGTDDEISGLQALEIAERPRPANRAKRGLDKPGIRQPTRDPVPSLIGGKEPA